MGAADGRVPRAAVAGADVKNVGDLIIGHAVPNGAAAATRFPPFAGPGFRRHFQFRMFETFGRIAGHRVEAPHLFAGVRVVRRKEPARGIIGAARSDNHLALYDPNGRGEHGVGLFGHLGAPHRFAGFLVERDQRTIEHPLINPAVVHRDPAIGGGTADALHYGARNLGVPAPFQLAGARIDGEHHVPAQAAIHHSVRNQHGSFHAGTSGRLCFPGPGEAEPLHICGVDLLQRAEMRLGIVAAVSQPFIAILGGGAKGVVIDLLCLLCLRLR